MSAADLIWPRMPLGRHEPSAWASSASTALDLLGCGVAMDESIWKGLEDGLRACDVLIQGDAQRRSSTFSVAGMEAQCAVERVERLGGRELVTRAPDVKARLRAVMDERGGDFAGLRTYFFELVLLHLRGHEP